MSLTDRYDGDRVTATQPSSFTCPHYLPRSGSKRCRHYLKGGACARPDELMCVEWLRANGHAVPAASKPPGDSPGDGGARVTPVRNGATDLFGNPLPEEEPTSPPEVKSATPAAETTPPAQETTELQPLCGLTPEDIESFKALGVEVCFHSDAFGEVWLVPEHTGQERQEITPEYAATICHVLHAFPGSRVVAFERNAKPSKEADA